MSSIIQLLPDHVANQIAAGEVVQRPASVVKELLENSVDAKATDIKLIVKDGGKSLVQVIDNGGGMSVTDARLCFERHATSKIRMAEDLFALHTKGFRGEALASIAAIAHVELKTRQEQDELGTHLVIEGSKVVAQDVAVLPKGTSFSVKNLFFNIPARRNFLKSETVEMRHIIDEFHRVAMAHPKISFSLFSNGSELFNLPASNLRQRIVNIFGGKTNEKLVPVNEQTEIVTLEGFIGKPEFGKKNRGEQFFFVNDRFIKNGYLHHAVMSAYEGLLKEGVQPSYFIYLQVPPHTLDINIHPTKTEVKFDEEQSLYAILRSSVKHSLGQFSVAPVLDFDKDASLEVPYHYKNKETETPTIAVRSDFNPFRQETEKKSSYTAPSYKKNTASWEGLYTGLKEEKNIPLPVYEPETEQILGSLFDEKEEEASVKTYQIHRKYIVSPIKSGIVIIHQQRAHERILYEEFLKNITLSKTFTQKLLFPVTFYFSGYEIALLKELQPALEQLGFEFEVIEKDKSVLVGLPVNISEKQAQQVLEQLILDLKEGVPESGFCQNDSIAKSLAQSLSIKKGMLLTEKEQTNIVDALFACKQPDSSPFGKTTFITMKLEELDKRF
ncbi:MAG: DNA mismatch repair endonuclease MutL [Flavobacteriaceae bacterium]